MTLPTMLCAYSLLQLAAIQADVEGDRCRVEEVSEIKFDDLVLKPGVQPQPHTIDHLAPRSDRQFYHYKRSQLVVEVAPH